VTPELFLSISSATSSAARLETEGNGYGREHAGPGSKQAAPLVMGLLTFPGYRELPHFSSMAMRHYGAYDIESLSKAVKLALARVKISAA
jgi:hypothetical protein